MFRPQRLRRLASHLLLVWLFALGTGVANACVYGYDFGHELAARHGQRDGAMVHQTDLQDANCHEDPAGQLPNGPCAKFCDELSLIRQSAKPLSDPLGVVCPALLPTPSATLQTAAAPLVTVMDEPGLHRAAIPIAIAFLRLTL